MSTQSWNDAREHEAGAEAFVDAHCDRGRRGLVLELGRDRGQLAEVDVDERPGAAVGVSRSTHHVAHSASPISATYGPVSS